MSYQTILKEKNTNMSFQSYRSALKTAFNDIMSPKLPQSNQPMGSSSSDFSDLKQSIVNIQRQLELKLQQSQEFIIRNMKLQIMEMQEVLIKQISKNNGFISQTTNVKKETLSKKSTRIESGINSISILQTKRKPMKQLDLAQPSQDQNKNFNKNTQNLPKITITGITEDLKRQNSEKSSMSNTSEILEQKLDFLKVNSLQKVPEIVSESYESDSSADLLEENLKLSSIESENCKYEGEEQQLQEMELQKPRQQLYPYTKNNEGDILSTKQNFKPATQTTNWHINKKSLHNIDERYKEEIDIHYQYMCDDCNQYPIVGKRYQVKDRYVDVCYKCAKHNYESREIRQQCSSQSFGSNIEIIKLARSYPKNVQLQLKADQEFKFKIVNVSQYPWNNFLVIPQYDHRALSIEIIEQIPSTVQPGEVVTIKTKAQTKQPGKYALTWIIDIPDDYKQFLANNLYCIEDDQFFNMSFRPFKVQMSIKVLKKRTSSLLESILLYQKNFLEV